MTDSQLKVMHLTYDMRIGGTEKVILNIVEGSRNSEILMSVLCLESPIGPFGKILEKSGIRITSLSRRQGFDFSLVIKIRSIIKSHSIDVLHCHQYTPWVYGALSAIGLPTRVIFTEHGRFYPDNTNWKRKLINPILLLATKKVTAISKATKQALRQFEYIPLEKTDVIYNGIAPLPKSSKEIKQLKRSLCIPEESIVFGTVSRMDPIKNHKLLINAFYVLSKDYPKSVLLIVGDGEEKENIIKIIDDKKISERVVLTGYVERPAKLIETMDVFLLPSLSEGTSMTLLECMSLGKPAIVTDVGGNPEVISHGKTGIVVKNDCLEELVMAMKKLAFNDGEREILGKNAKIRFEECFSAKKMTDAYHLIYTRK